MIVEDPTLDSFVVRPVVEGLLSDLSIRSSVEVLRDPYLSGVDQALDMKTIAAIVDENRMVDLFLLIVDRDCNRANNVERAAERQAEHSDCLLACLAVEEVETWMLALHLPKLKATWAEVRAECDPKEEFAEPFLADQGWTLGVGRGRKAAMRAMRGGGWKSLFSLCEEIRALRDDVAAWHAGR